MENLQESLTRQALLRFAQKIGTLFLVYYLLSNKQEVSYNTSTVGKRLGA